MDVYEEGTDDDEREILIKLIPSVVETMRNHGQLETFVFRATHISKPLDMEHFVSYTPNIFYCCIVVPHLSC
jgi:hypothetical protein